MLRLTWLAVLVTGCVTNGTYHHKIDELTAAANAREHALQDKLAGRDKDVAGRDRELAEAKTKVGTLETSLAASQQQVQHLQADLDGNTALIATLKDRLEKLGQNVDTLTKERADTNKRLEELRAREAAAEARAATFKNLVAKLHAMIDSGRLKVVIRGGRMIIALPNDILFDSGKTEVKKEGKLALGEVAKVLATVPDRVFLVAGHTDNVPIKTELFPSNWELSTRRAVEVVHYLIDRGMNPRVLAAAGYGEFDPVAANDTAEHRAQNRRIEIVLQPNLSDLPPIDAP